MPPTTQTFGTVPRFLLPRRGSIWQRPQVRNITFKPKPKASRQPPKTTEKSQAQSTKPLVLEKPAKFNPPSHGQRRVKAGPRYPGPSLSEEQIHRQKTKKYPTMMPPEGSFMRWFLTNRSIHMYITMGTLASLASFVWITNFRRSSPFADMLPPFSNLFSHPIAYLRTFGEVIKLTSDYNTAQTMERRKAKVEDVAKRHEYRKAHGLDKDEGFGGWTAKSDAEVLGSGIRLGDGSEAQLAGEGGEGEEQEPVRRRKRPVKMWLGIW
ncbi:hypothetical protein BJ875DRAFT_270574 [Amylocarpus encephaloides]|uniref:Uncharacterized protein n=1 Tax=Amylocarpus encephaloides TaxID=45428 RepID=A0A9P7YKV6_9HELO|nr:hypothetical protein BJ875DRAFT_270574 [Amylocarpus encephaloides]